jgi:hypothetical protein
MKMRYIRLFTCGNSSSTSNLITELQAFEGATNRASGIIPTSNVAAPDDISKITDGITDSTIGYARIGYTSDGINAYAQIDLGAVYEIDTIKFWLYVSRTHYGVRIHTSQDGIHWVVPYDSAIQGDVVDTIDGTSVDCSNFFSINGFDFPLYDTANVPRVKVGTKYLQLTTDPTLSFNVSGDKRFVADPNGTPLYIQCIPSTFTSWTTANTTSQSTSTSWTTSNSTTTSWSTSYSTSYLTQKWTSSGDYSDYTYWYTSKTTSRTTSQSTTTSWITSQATTTSWSTSITTCKTTKQGGWI